MAVAGSVSVLALLQLKSVEELFPSLAKEATSPKRIEDVSGGCLLIGTAGSAHKHSECTWSNLLIVLIVAASGR